MTGFTRSPSPQTTASRPAVAPFAHATAAGPTLYVTGQMPTDITGSLVGPDVATQTDQVLYNLLRVTRTVRQDDRRCRAGRAYLLDWDDTTRSTRRMPCGSPIGCPRVPVSASYGPTSGRGPCRNRLVCWRGAGWPGRVHDRMPMDAATVNRFLNEYLKPSRRTSTANVRSRRCWTITIVPLIITSDDGVIALTTDSDVVTVIKPGRWAARPAVPPHQVLQSTVTGLNATSALYRASLARRDDTGKEIDCPTIARRDGEPGRGSPCSPAPGG